MSQSFTIQDGMFLLNGKPFFLYSGEVQYFRLKKATWKNILLKAKKANLNTVSSYIPWCWHERREGIFDFRGKTYPETDLIEFLETIKKLGLYFFARIGPISNAELINEGLPAWLVKKYPQVLLRRKDNAISSNPALSSYLSPGFQRFTGLWYDKVLPIIEKYRTENGGPVILIQLCNEIGMLNWLLKQPDYNKNTTRLYREYLELKYKNIGTLNKLYGKRFVNFSQIDQPDSMVDKDNFLMYLDWAYFYRDYFSRYFSALKNNLKGYRINLPLAANIPQFLDYDLCGRAYQGITTTSMFRDFNLRAEGVILGGAYQARRCDFENFHDVVAMNETIKSISSAYAPRICAEMQFGGWQDRPRIYPKDVELPIKLSIAHGLNGINGYVFAGGKNLKGLAFRGTYNEWQAPIGSDGKTKPHLKAIASVGLFLKAFGIFMEKTGNVYDNVSIGFYQPYYATEFLKGDFINGLIAKRDKLFFDGILRLVLLAGFKFGMFDLEREPLAELKRRKLIWVFSLDFMDSQTQVKLAEYVKSGGKLVISPEIPRFDLLFKKSEILMREFGITSFMRSNEDVIYIADTDRDVYVERELHTFSIKNARIIARTERGSPCAAIKMVGKGRVLVVSFGLRHIFDYHIDVARYLLGLLGAKPVFYSKDPAIHTVMRRNDDFGFLCVFNLDDIEKNTTLQLKASFKGTVISFIGKKIRLAGRSALFLPLNIPLDRGLKILYSTAEVYGFNRKKNLLELILFSEIKNNFNILLSCPEPEGSYLEKEALNFKYGDGKLNITCSLNEGFQKLRLIFK